MILLMVPHQSIAVAHSVHKLALLEVKPGGNLRRVCMYRVWRQTLGLSFTLIRRFATKLHGNYYFWVSGFGTYKSSSSSFGGSERDSPPLEFGMGGGLSTIRDFGRRGSKPNLLLSKLGTAGGEVVEPDVGALDDLSDSSAPFRGSVDSGIAELFVSFAVLDIGIEPESSHILQPHLR